jgi:predicted amidohydrolase
MKVSVGQIAVKQTWEENAAATVAAIEKARDERADLLVLPEAILARNIGDPDAVLKSAQTLDGPFMQAVAKASAGSGMTIIFTIHTPDGAARVHNTLVAVRDGKVIAQYRKLHLYDAFSMQESRNVAPGADVPPLLEVAGLKIGLMTCYDIRFPELARRLADDGADVLVLPAAWVKGPLKEYHWETLVTARALENTCYLVACGECGERSIGMSMVIDPLGVVIARTGEGPAQFSAEIDAARIAHARKVLPALANRRFARPELRLA